MPDGWSDLIKSLRLHHVLFVILGSATIWVAAHSFAEPGSTVKVLWGLVEYTKPSGAEATRISNDRTAIYQTPPTATSIDPSEGRENHGDIELSQDQAILSTHAATEKNAKKATEDLRIKKALRPLSPLETGIPMSKSPPGTFFFAANFELTRDPEISARRSIFSSVEIHHRTQGKFVVVCYTTESDAERLRLSDRGTCAQRRGRCR